MSLSVEAYHLAYWNLKREYVTKIKICGLIEEEHVDLLCDLGVDAMGLTLVTQSPRCVSVVRAAELRARVRGHVQVVVLTADQSLEELDAFVTEIRPDGLQLHGSETPTFLAALRQRVSCRLIKAIAVRGAEDLEQLAAYAPFVDRFLLDAGPPIGSVVRGGHGVSFDWNSVKGAACLSEAFLAGGLTPFNVGTAVAELAPWGVDVASGVEKARGIKDPDLMVAFVMAVRKAGQEKARQAERKAGE